MKILNLIIPTIFGAVLLFSFGASGQSNNDGIHNFRPRNFEWSFLHKRSIHNIPLGVLPMQHNSSFAGESDGIRLNSIFFYDVGSGPVPIPQQKQEMGFHASYDQFIPALRSGIGVSVNSGSSSYSWEDYRGTGVSYSTTFHYSGLTLAIAPKFSIKGKYTLSPSIDFSYGFGKAETELPEVTGFIDLEGQHTWLESRIGLLFNTSKYYAGLSTAILDQHFYDDQRYRLLNSFITYFQAGYTFQKSATSKFSFTPQVAYRISANEPGAFTEYLLNSGAINFTFRYDSYIAGFNNTGIHLGWQTRKLRIMLSNNPFRSGNKFYENGNVSLRYIFKNSFEKASLKKPFLPFCYIKK